MMRLTLPSGRSVRCQSQRRYVLVADIEHCRPAIIKRSDNLDTITKAWRNYHTTANRAAVMDNVTGEVIRFGGLTSPTPTR